MKYLSLPGELLRFWYPSAFRFFVTTLKNSLLYLEEDLAVTLMWRLLFVPLFHDSSVVGMVLSFLFRLTRILFGLAALITVGVIIMALALAWFLLPLLVLYFISASTWWAAVLRLILASSVVFFLFHFLSRPAKKLKQISQPDQLWQASTVNPKHVQFSWLVQHSRVQDLCRTAELDLTQITATLTATPLSIKDWQEAIWEIKDSLKTDYLQADQIFVAGLAKIPTLTALLEHQQLSLGTIKESLDFLYLRDAHWRLFPVWDPAFQIKHLKGINRGWLSAPTPTLDQFSVDLTQHASQERTEEFIGRPEEVKQLVNDLSLNNGKNVLLVGEPGTGKTTLLHHLAQLIVAGNAPDKLATKRIVQLDSSQLLSGITSQGQLAERLKIIFEEVQFSGQVIICLEEISQLGVGQAAHEYNLYALLQPYLESTDLQFIATTEPGNYRQIIEKEAAFARVFHQVQLPPASAEDTLDVLKMRAIEAQRYQKINYSVPALHTIVDLVLRYRHDRVLPDSALQVFSEAQSLAAQTWVTKKLVEQAVQEQTHIPIVEAASDQKDALLHLEDTIHQQYIDQEPAVVAVSKALRRNAAQLRDGHHPIGTFLFVGPTGVGKTELCKVLSKVFFDNKLVRFDMSEYQTTESIDRFIGTGQAEGLMPAALAQNPYCLLLLDEFEKADTRVLNLFLQILDEGRMTSSSGKVVDFTNSIIVATSNAGSVLVAEEIKNGKTAEQLKESLTQELLKVFHPELLNRFDDTVIFKPLAPEDLEKVVQLKLTALEKHLKIQGYEVDFSPDLRQALVEKGYDSVMGARPLTRLIQDTIEDKLSTMILSGTIEKGTKLHLDKQILE